MAASDVITLDDAKDHLNMTGTADDFELAVHITAASQLVESFVGPVITRQFTDSLRWGPAVVLNYCPVVSLVSVTPAFGGAALDVATLRVRPDTGEVFTTSGGRLGCGAFDIVYTAGRAVTVVDVPDALALATKVIVAHLWSTQRAVTFGPGAGPDTFAGAPLGSGYAIPYRARDLMLPFRTVVVA